jgi:hypothetical protein
VRSITKIDSKNSLYPHKHFIEHLVDAFEKSPRENNLNHESSSLLIRRLKNKYRHPLQQFTHRSTQKSKPLKSRTKPSIILVTALAQQLAHQPHSARYSEPIPDEVTGNVENWKEGSSIGIGIEPMRSVDHVHANISKGDGHSHARGNHWRHSAEKTCVETSWTKKLRAVKSRIDDGENYRWASHNNRGSSSQ